MITSIEQLTGYFGHLELKKEEGKHYWGLEDYNGTSFKEIPEYLYNAILKFTEDTED